MISIKLVFSFSFSFVLIAQSLADKNVTAGCTITDYSQISSVLSSCTNVVVGNLKVPANKQVNLNLKDGSTLTFRGTTIFEVGTLNDWLISVSGNRITVQGEKGSIIDGQGQYYWDGHGGASGRTKSKLFLVKNVNNAKFTNINLKNCPMFCSGVTKATDLTIEGWNINNSAGDQLGKNTDGIGIAWSKNVHINNVFIHNQDQCVYVNQGSNMLFTNLHCVNSNGIAATAGFGANNYEENTTKNITFCNVVMDGGLYGLQVIGMSKPGGGAGEITDITFENIELRGSRSRGIWMQGDYGDPGHPNNNLEMKNIRVSNVHGTVEKNAKAVEIFCGKKCSNWQFSNINIRGSHVKNICNFEPSGFRC